MGSTFTTLFQIPSQKVHLVTFGLPPLPTNKLKCCAVTLVCAALVCCSIPGKVTQRQAESPELLHLEKKVYQLINQYRISANLSPLAANEAITQQARIHSYAMARRKVPFGHDGFAKRVNEISKHLAHRRVAENVAYNKGYSDCARQAVQDWLKSTEHNRNIRGNYRVTGIGVAKNREGGYYFTQIFWQ